ncbi:hypothetical protein BDQ17DRAFT_1551417 [Cyathus striatus]|nr:hypothetical protein BDQ17DRAFT_1551417 [Cyathus striatus]
MFSSKYILAAFAMVSSASAAALSAANVRAIEKHQPENGCFTIPVVSDTCTSFTGGLSFLDETVSNAQVPAGFVCTFFSAFGCSSSSPNDKVVLTGGTWDFFSVPGNNGNESFNDEASSFSCSPI